MQTDKTFTDENLERAYQLAFFLFPNVNMALSLTITACELVSAIQRSQNRRARSKNHYGAKIPNEALLQYAVLLASEIVEMDEEKFRALVGSEYQLTRDDQVVRYIKYLIWRTSRMRSCYVAIGLGCLLYRYNPMSFFHLSFGCIDSKNIRRVKGRIVQWLKERFEHTGIIKEGGGDVKVTPADSVDYELVRQALRMFTPWGENYSELAPKETLLETLFDEESDLPDWIRTWAFIDPDHAGIESLIREYNKLFPAKPLADPCHMLWIPAFEVQPSDDPTKRMKAPSLSEREKFLLRNIVDGNQILQNIVSGSDDLYEELYFHLVGSDCQEINAVHDPKMSDGLRNLVYEVVSETCSTWTKFIKQGDTFDSYAIGRWSNPVIGESRLPDGFIKEKNSDYKVIDFGTTGIVTGIPLTECKKPVFKTALIIGIGGTGSDILRRIRKHYFEKYGALSQFPSVSYLCIDAVGDTLDNQRGVPFPALTELEPIPLYDPQVSFSDLRDNSGAYPKILGGRLPSMNIGLLDRQDRTGHIPMLRRVGCAFIQCCSVRLCDCFRKILNRFDAMRRYNFNLETDMVVYLVSSAHGGTGAGTLIDAAVMLRVLPRGGVWSSVKTFGLVPILKQLSDPAAEAVYWGRPDVEQDKFDVRAAANKWTLYTDAEHVISWLEVCDKTLEYGGYRSVEGVWLPFTQWLSIGGQLVRELFLTKIDPDPEFSPSYFARSMDRGLVVHQANYKGHQLKVYRIGQRTIPTWDLRAARQASLPEYLVIPTLIDVPEPLLTPTRSLNNKVMSQPDSLSVSDLRWTRRTSASSAVRLPRFLGSTLRGAFGAALKQVLQERLVTARSLYRRALMPEAADMDYRTNACGMVELLQKQRAPHTLLDRTGNLTISVMRPSQILVIVPGLSSERQSRWQAREIGQAGSDRFHVFNQQCKNTADMNIGSDTQALVEHPTVAGGKALVRSDIRQYCYRVSFAIVTIKGEGLTREEHLANAVEVSTQTTIDITSPCPTVTGINPTSGQVGSNVIITGMNLSGVTAVKFANNGSASFTVNSATQITTTDWVSTFGTSNGLDKARKIAHQLGQKIAVGDWLSGGLEANEREILTLIRIAQSGQAGIAIVGTEVLPLGELSEDHLIGYISRVKQAVPGIPVTTHEVYGILLSHPSLLSAVDVVFANIYGYWERVRINNAVAALSERYNHLVAVYEGETVYISETGWPSCGNQIGEVVPSPENASFYFKSITTWARANNVPYFYFEAFDESWKARYEGPQGMCWGVWDKDGNLMLGMQVSSGNIDMPLDKIDYASDGFAWVPSANSSQHLVYSLTSILLNETTTDGPHCYGSITPSDDTDQGSRNIYVIISPKNIFGNVRGTNFAGSYFLNGVLQRTEAVSAPNLGKVVNASVALRRTTQLTFYARGKNGGEQVEFFMGGIGRDPFNGVPNAPYRDPTLRIPSIGAVISLTQPRFKYTIDLSGADLSYVLGGFGWVTNAANNPNGATFWIDDIQYNKSRLDEPRLMRSSVPTMLQDFDQVFANIALTYDNALAILVFLALGTDDDLRRTKLIGDAFAYAVGNDPFYQNEEFWNGYQAGDLIIPLGWIPNGNGLIEASHDGTTAWCTLAEMGVNPYSRLASLPLITGHSKDGTPIAKEVIPTNIHAWLIRLLDSEGGGLYCKPNQDGIWFEGTARMDTTKSSITDCYTSSPYFRSNIFLRKDYFVVPSLWPTELKQFIRKEMKVMKEPTEDSQNDCETSNHTGISVQPISCFDRYSDKALASCNIQSDWRDRFNPLPLGMESTEAIRCSIDSLTQRRKNLTTEPSCLKVRVDGKERMQFDPKESRCRPFRIPIDSLFVEVCAEDSQGNLVLAAFLVPDLDYLETGALYEESVTTEAGQVVGCTIFPILSKARKTIGCRTQITWKKSVQTCFWQCQQQYVECLRAAHGLICDDM